ncbi:MAG: polymer-forming cytoskeletal protein [Myxococcales bacterium]|nr:polymer-forming cytoskeletal protein [Myxococcales bacterium]
MPGLNEVNALLGKGSEFEGKLTFEGTVRIDGRFKGEIFSEDTLIVGESAQVTAEIRVDTVIIYGDVIGNIYSRSCVELHAPARLRGNIVTPNLQADKGVIFDGNVKMQEDTPPPRPSIQRGHDAFGPPETQAAPPRYPALPGEDGA